MAMQFTFTVPTPSDLKSVFDSLETRAYLFLNQRQQQKVNQILQPRCHRCLQERCYSGGLCRGCLDNLDFERYVQDCEGTFLLRDHESKEERIAIG